MFEYNVSYRPPECSVHSYPGGHRTAPRLAPLQASHRRGGPHTRVERPGRGGLQGPQCFHLPEVRDNIDNLYLLSNIKIDEANVSYI